MVGLRDVDSIKRPLRRLERKGIEVRLGEIENIDPEGRAVTVDGEMLVADHLIVALGAELAPETIPGLSDSDAGHNFYTQAGAVGLRAALESTRKGCIVVLTAAPAYKCDDVNNPRVGGHSRRGRYLRPCSSHATGNWARSRRR